MIFGDALILGLFIKRILFYDVIAMHMEHPSSKKEAAKFIWNIRIYYAFLIVKPINIVLVGHVN